MHGQRTSRRVDIRRRKGFTTENTEGTEKKECESTRSHVNAKSMIALRVKRKMGAFAMTRPSSLLIFSVPSVSSVVNCLN
jgi:hypothetical protein